MAVGELQSELQAESRKREGGRAADTERHFGAVPLDVLKQQGRSGTIAFTDPDVIIVIDTVDDRAGAALWTREDLLHYRMLRPD